MSGKISVRRLTAFFSGHSLRGRILITTMVLVVLAFILVDVLTYSSTRTFLYGQIDERVTLAERQAYKYILTAFIHHHPFSPSTVWETKGLSERISSDVYLEILSYNGKVLYRHPSGSYAEPDPPPVLPPHLPVQRNLPPNPFSYVRSHVYRPQKSSFELSAHGFSDSGVFYRAEAVSVPPSDSLLVAAPIDNAQATLSLLLKIEVVASAVVLMLLFVLVLWAVRLGLKPLDKFSEVVNDIAAGDLSRRLAVDMSAGEITKLGSALNSMLGQIETAFDQKSVSENKLKRFIADASHELRTPLTSILGYAQLYRRGACKEKDSVDKAMERIESEAVRVNMIVDEMLFLARMDQESPLDITSVDLVSLVWDVVEDANVTNPNGEITLSTQGDELVVPGDEHRLRQVVGNLVTNAIVHTPLGTPISVSVYTTSLETVPATSISDRLNEKNRYAVIRVTDKGPGVDAHQLSKMFDPFWQGDDSRWRNKSTKRSNTVSTEGVGKDNNGTGNIPTGAAEMSQGAGLGLTIVDAIVKAHYGKVNITSELGKGTEVTVLLPLARP